MIDWNELEARHARYTEALKKGNEATKAAIFKVLAATPITRIVVSFDGCGDSGQIEDIEAFSGADRAVLPEVLIDIQETTWSNDQSFTRTGVRLGEAIESLCYGYLEEKHAGWENNEGASGEFVFDVAAARLELAFSARFTSTEDYSHSF